MTDIILKLYDNWNRSPATAAHILFGDVLDYQIIDNSNYNLDTAWFKINNSDGRWSNEFNVDSWSGSETIQVWRAFSRDDSLIGSGTVTNIQDKGEYILLQGEGMSSLLKRRIVDKVFYQTKDGSGNDIAGNFILLDTVYGLINGSTNGLLGSTYGAITVDTDAGNLPVTTYPRTWKFDGANLWDACVDVAKASYGSNGKNFDVYLYETYASPATFTLKCYFKERESTASAKTIVLSDVHVPGVDFQVFGKINFNKVIVRGEVNPNSIYPLDSDTWTESSTNWSMSEEAGTNTVSAVTAARHYGDYAVEFYRDDRLNRVCYYYDDNTTLADSKYNKIAFWACASSFDNVEERLTFDLCLGVKDVYTNERAVTYDFGNDPFPKLRDIFIVAHASGATLSTFDFTYYEFPLPKPNSANGWDTSDTFQNSLISVGEWNETSQIGFRLDDDAGEEIQYLVIDGLHFIGNAPFEGSATDGSPTYSREYVHSDMGLKSNTDCTNMAQNILRRFKEKQYSGSVELRGVKRDYSLNAGNTVEVVIPSEGLNIQTGQTPSVLGIQQIVYTPNTQALSLGRVYSNSEMINELSRKYRLLSKIQ